GLSRRARPAPAAAEEVAVQDAAQPVRARAHAEGDEADREDEREKDEDPLRLAAQARKEHRLLVGRSGALALRLGLCRLTPCLSGSSRHGRLGYLAFQGADALPVELLADLAQPRLRLLPAE